jgi:acetylornithine deacetylase
MLKRIVSIDSRLGREAAVQQFMFEEFKKISDPQLKVEIVPIIGKEIRDTRGYSPVLDWGYYDEDPKKYNGKVNVIATHQPKTVTGKSLILNGHVDVVPLGTEESWTTPPFQADVRDGRLYGRGSGDMKAGVIAYVQAYKALVKLGFAPAAPVQMQTVIEEECTGNGCLHVAEKFKADAVIIPEPFNQTIVTALLGVMWFRVKVKGKPVHVLDTSAGTNAIESAFALYEGLKELEKSWNEKIHESYQNFKHPINFNLGVMNGGDWASSVPAECVMHVRVGFFPGVTLDEVKKEVEAKLKETAEKKKIYYTIEYNGFHAEGCVMDKNDQMMKLLGECHKKVTNEEPVYAPVTCTTDARFFQLYHNTPATCYGPEATSIHGIDESVSLASMNSVARVLAVFMAEWCGLEKI